MLKKFFEFLKFSKVRLNEVFTPSSAATLTFVERIELEEQIDKALSIPGMQLILHGHSGSGKTTIIQNMLNRSNTKFIVTNCILDTTINQIVLEAFDKLNPFYKSEKSSKKGVKINAELKAEYLAIDAVLKAEMSNEVSDKMVRALPVQLTPQRLAEFLGSAEVVWIIEDFHKVAIEERCKLSQILKIFVDTANRYKNVKLIAIGAVGTAREMVNYGAELTNRVSEIFVPLMTKEELEGIIRKGEKLLNVLFNSKVRKDILVFSNSLAAICHHLCYSICYYNRVNETQQRKRYFGEEMMQRAILEYLKQNSDSFKETLDRALKPRDGKFDNTKGILLAFCKLEKDELTKKEILGYRRNKQIYGTTITEYLNLLTTPEYGEILRVDTNSGKFSFFNPFIKAYALMHFATEERDTRKVKMQVEIHLEDRFEEIMRYIMSTRLEILNKEIDDLD